MSSIRNFIFWLFSLLYRLAIAIWKLRWRYASKVKLGCKVISIGNIAVGGTGKTPLVIYIARLAVQAGYKTAVVAKGYKRTGDGPVKLNNQSTWQEAGDEPLEIFIQAPGVNVYVDKSKTAGARQALADGAAIIIIDDGFQHRRLGRDLDIVCLDWCRPLGPGGLLPLGTLREPQQALKRADAIVYTTFNPAAKPIERLPAKLEISPVFFASTEITGFINLKTRAVCSIRDIGKLKSLAFCGLAQPGKFQMSLAEIGVKPVAFIKFRDHYCYSQADLDGLGNQAKDLGVDCLLTTSKDSVKIRSLDFAGFDIYSAMLEISIRDNNGADQRSQFKEFLGL